jgi:hypothetical protein
MKDGRLKNGACESRPQIKGRKNLRERMRRRRNFFAIMLKCGSEAWVVWRCGKRRSMSDKISVMDLTISYDTRRNTP